MKKTALLVRCVPRYGYEHTEVRTIELDLPRNFDEESLREALRLFFAFHGISDALYSIEVDDNGYFAVINDEAYAHPWGQRLL